MARRGATHEQYLDAAAASRKEVRRVCYLEILEISKREYRYKDVKKHLMRRVERDQDFSKGEMEAIFAPFEAVYAKCQPIEID
jgi:hypothetical protein